MTSSDFVYESLEKQASQTPQKVFLDDGTRTVTYTEAFDLVRDGNPINVDNPNSIEGVIELIRSRAVPAVNQLDLLNVNSNTHSALLRDILIKHPGNLVKTSGSTGTPKLVLVTYESQLVTAQSINLNILQGRLLDELILLPLRHSSGLGRLRAAILRGASIRIASLPLSPKKISQALRDSTNSALALTPSTWRLLVSTFGETIWDRLSEVKSIEFGSAPLTAEEIHLLVTKMPIQTDLLMHYGLTEASRSFLRDLRTDDNSLSLGRPLPHVKASFIDPSSDRGELVITGPHVAKFILDGNDLSIAEDGYLTIHTGDLVTNINGEFQLEGRLKEVINTGGIKVSPSQLEAQISDLGVPGEIAVVGTPHEFLGEQVVLFVENRYLQNYNQISSQLRATLPSGHMPNLVIALEVFPVLPNAKTDRMKLKEIAATHDS